MTSLFSRPLGLILLVALLHGVVYVFMMPPWQHYDEPSHFEYVGLLVSRGALPDLDTVDLDFRQKLVQSMIANDFYQGLPGVPDPATIAPGVPVSGLQYSQLDEPPLYYLLASMPVLFLQERNPAVQLYGARGISLGLFLLTVFAVWGMTTELTAAGNPLRWLVPICVALLPGFVDLMTAVNNDVGAVAAFSWFLWGSLHLLNRPFSSGTVFWVLGSAVVCLFTKSTVFVAVPLSGIVLFLGWLRGIPGKGKKLVCAGLAGLAIAGVFGLFTWQDAANWHRATSQPTPTRVKAEQAPLGEFALQLNTSAPTTPDWLRPLNQPLDPHLRNANITFGVWMWVDADSAVNGPVALRTPILNSGVLAYFETISVGAAPTFYAFHVNLPPTTNRLWLTLYPIERGKESTVYYDGFVLAEGEYSLTEVPVFDDVSGSSGMWGGMRFENLVRNPSAERAWPALRPAIDTQLSRFLPDNVRLSTLLFGLFDWEYTGWYFRTTAHNFLETFWGRFGWGHIPLNNPGWYTVWGYLSVAGVAGFGLFLVRRRDRWDGRLVFLFLATSLIWGAAWLRGEISIFTSTVFIPGARYAYPAIALTLLLLVAGWKEWGRLALQRLTFFQLDDARAGNTMIVLFFLAFDIFSIYSVLIFYQRI